ncbi:MAG: hypothetical protein HWD59_12575 [Coxiellaceae bacterium]|nr:MAG: hypothetical protein HWD59_12575 [Coxiellaceae bacterium]
MLLPVGINLTVCIFDASEEFIAKEKLYDLMAPLVTIVQATLYGSWSELVLALPLPPELEQFASAYTLEAKPNARTPIRHFETELQFISSPYSQ